MRGDISAGDTIIHAAELEDRCSYAPEISCFLTPAEQMCLWHKVRFPQRLFFWGGYSGAERRAAVFLPDWAADQLQSGKAAGWNDTGREALFRGLIFGTDAPFDDIPEKIALLQIDGSGHGALSHRNILGALMALGITRQSVGDICVLSDISAVAAVTGKLSGYICENLTSAGSDKVQARIAENPAAFAFERKFEKLSVTVASMRLDGIVSAVTGLSRAKSAEHIAAGLVQISGISVTECSAEASVGETITVRGYGKFLIDSESGLTRKSRIRLNINKYV